MTKENNKEKKKKVQKKNGNKKEREIVFVDINNILEFAKKSIMERYGGVSFTDIEYADEIDKLKFTIPKINRKGKCGETFFFESEKIGKDGGCGETGGVCVCGEKAGHDSDHKCEYCGEEW